MKFWTTHWVSSLISWEDHWLGEETLSRQLQVECGPEQTLVAVSPWLRAVGQIRLQPATVNWRIITVILSDESVWEKSLVLAVRKYLQRKKYLVPPHVKYFKPQKRNYLAELLSNIPEQLSWSWTTLLNRFRYFGSDCQCHRLWLFQGCCHHDHWSSSQRGSN